MNKQIKDMEVINKLEKRENITFKKYYNRNEFRNSVNKGERAQVACQLNEDNQVVSLTIRDISLEKYNFLKDLINLNTLDLRNNQITDYSFFKDLINLNTLDLRNNHITDASFLNDLINLNTLDLRNNQITDYSFLNDLINLNTLDLRNNHITDYSFLNDLINLNSLNLRNNQITDASFLNDLINLNSLDLGNNHIIDYSFLNDLINLNSLDLRNNQITDASFLTDSINLNSLNLRNNQITDVSFLNDLVNLYSLDLSYNNITDASFLKDLIDLNLLYLRNNRITDTSFLKDLINLNSLNLSYNKITDASFLNDLISLNSLYLRNNKITDASFLKDLINLNSLDFSDNQITDASFLKDLKNLNSLDFSDNQITDASFLKDLKNLNSLDLRNNQITDYSFFKDLINLNSLDLGNNHIIDYSFLNDLINLNSLDLRNNQITDASFLTDSINLNSLNLRNNQITDVSFLNDLVNLYSLDLSYNTITDASFLKDLTTLTLLDLSDNQITDISFLTDLTNLTLLNLRSNQITDYSFLKDLTTLTLLDLSYNQITDYSFLKDLINLSSLNLRNNQIIDAGFLKDLVSLNSIYLSDNQIIDTRFLKDLINLSSLNLRNNQITDAGFLKYLTNLNSLNLRNNQITDANFLKDLINLNYVELDGNPIVEPTEKIWQGGINDIRRYYKQIEDWGEDYLYEAKIILVGEPGAGKTSLMKKMISPDYTIPNVDEKETIGIQVERYPFPFPGRPEVTFKANIWDFGGQDIQYTIHQFFLTSDALYILVVDDRKENCDYDYWFNIIRVLGERSPILVFLNEINKIGLPNFEYSTYCKRYSDLKIEKREVDLSKPYNQIEELFEKIKKDVTQLKEVGKPLPKQWIPIRNELEKYVSKNHISYESFIKICNNNKLKDPKDQEFLSKIFHNLGVFLHFSNDSNLFNTIFTNHKWVVDALYTIIKDKKLKENNGLFTKTKIFELWGTEYSDIEKNQLLNLMLKDNFDLCYKLESSGSDEKYLFPLLLPSEVPSFDKAISYKDSLRFRFQYKFMPKGIITKVIVRLSDFIYSENEKDIVWRYGTVLKKYDTPAIISQDVDEEGLKVIDIAVGGLEYDRKELLTIIKEEIKRIHVKSFKDLPVNEMVPCFCQKCIIDNNPHFFEYNELKRYRSDGVYNIRCSRNPIFKTDVNKLLEGFELSEHEKQPSLKEQYDRVTPMDIYDDVSPIVENRLRQTLAVKTEPPINLVKKDGGNKKLWYEKWYYIAGLIAAVAIIIWTTIQIVNSFKSAPIKDEPIKQSPAIEQPGQDSVNVLRKEDSDTTK